MSGPPECRLLVDPPAPGDVEHGGRRGTSWSRPARRAVATLRFYEWNEPTLSLGYFQRYEDRDQHAASLECAVVRRQSGGGAILHDRELTYSLTLPASHPLAQNSPQLYSAVHEAILGRLSKSRTRLGRSQSTARASDSAIDSSSRTVPLLPAPGSGRRCPDAAPGLDHSDFRLHAKLENCGECPASAPRGDPAARQCALVPIAGRTRTARILRPRGCNDHRFDIGVGFIVRSR